MSQESKAILQRYIAVVNERDLGAIDEVVAKDFVAHHFPPGLPRGPEGVRQYTHFTLTAFPDVHINPEDVVAEGDRVSLRFTFSGTHKGEFMGRPATGREVSIGGMAMARIANGKLVEWWEYPDMLGMMQQLGWMPSP